MKGMIRHSTNISVSLPGEMQEMLRRAALDDNRSVSSLVTALVDSYLVREGYKYPGRDRIAPRPATRQTHIYFENFNE